MAKCIGILADICIGCKLGVACAYYITSTGKDHNFAKGISFGSLIWLVYYGALSKIGVTNTRYTAPKGVLSSWFNHMIFVIITTKAVIALGDDILFKPKYNTLSNQEN